MSKMTSNFDSPAELNSDQDAQLIANGYEPLAVFGKAPVESCWQSGEVTRQRLDAERSAHTAAKNTGLRTGRLVGIDIDVISEEHVARIVCLVEQEVGRTPLVRFGAKGRMLLYRNETPIQKITVVAQSKEKVEIMGLGQQVVAYGIHPDAGRPYRWVGGDDPDFAADPLSVPLTELPETTPDKLRNLARKVASLLTELGYGPAKTTGDILAEKDIGPVSSAFGYPVTAANIRSAASYLNPSAPRDKWMRWIAAIRSAPLAGDEDLTIRRRIARELSSGDLDRLKRGQPNNYQGPDDVDRVFDTMPPKANGVGIGTLFNDARSEGWKGNPFDAGKLAADNFHLPTNCYRQFPDLTKNGLPKATPENTRLAVAALGIECSHDTFHDKMLVGGHPIGQFAGEVSDNACLMMRTLIRKEFDFEPNAVTMFDAARQLCLHNPFYPFDPVCDYLNALEWDGVERIETWLIDYLGAVDKEFVRAVGRCVVIAAVRRARLPGTKFDQIVVLEGPEGLNKSTAIKILAGEENFSDQSILTETDKTQQELLKGVWLYEIADLTGISKADVDNVKAFASRTHDRARPAYGRAVVNQPRRCVLFATTNNDTYLQSQTGNRRFWPIKTGRIDIDRLRADRDQLWAEAAVQEAAGASILLPEALWPTAAEEQAQRLHADPWADKLANVIGQFSADPDGLGYEERISSNRLIEHILKIPADRATQTTFNRLKNVMHQLGWTGPGQMRIGQTKVRGYWRHVEKPAADVTGAEFEHLP